MCVMGTVPPKCENGGTEKGGLAALPTPLDAARHEDSNAALFAPNGHRGEKIWWIEWKGARGGRPAAGLPPTLRHCHGWGALRLVPAGPFVV